jgi:hypothetical protein
MSGKKAIKPYNIVPSVSAAASIAGTPSNAQYVDRLAYSVAFAGSPNGELFVESSIDGFTWIPLDMDQMLVTAPDTFSIDVQCTGFNSIRLHYVDAGMGGTGTMTAWVTGKES